MLTQEDIANNLLLTVNQLWTATTLILTINPVLALS